MSFKLLFDETFGQPIVTALAELTNFHPLRPQIVHLIDYVGREGEKDEDWAPKLSKEGWIVITADAGKHGGSKLPRICRNEKVTHVVLRGQLVHRQQFEKIRAVLVVWPDLIAATDMVAGTRFRLRLGPANPVLDAIEQPA